MRPSRVLITGSVQAVVHGPSVNSGGSVSTLADAHNTALPQHGYLCWYRQRERGQDVALVDVDTLAQVESSIVKAKDAIQIDANSTNRLTPSVKVGLGLSGLWGVFRRRAYVEGSTRALADGEIHSLTDGIQVHAMMTKAMLLQKPKLPVADWEFHVGYQGSSFDPTIRW